MALMSRLLTHLALIPARLLGHLPLSLSRRLLASLARPLRWAMRRRSHIVERNLELCFPEWDEARRSSVAAEHFRQLAEAVAETAFCWCHRGRLDERYGQIEGLEHLDRARSGGQGVLLVTGHTTCLELGARLFAESVPVHGVYRPLRNPVLNRFQNRGRGRYSPGMIERDNLRAMVRHLRAGEVVWYAPDQDFGPERSHFAPFFDLPTATARGLLELARLGRAVVVPMYPIKADGRVSVHIAPAFEDFPGEDPVADLSRYNRFLEARIRTAPAQYWWLHRRFKSRPEGGPSLY
ncbi:LpxL/LpxP family acyltransferase [Wenzhouxiangella marina]|uniref:Lauroyl/myristoyl acyltransferase n=1 Tax=Wenzhouxiangella marina TaxID=1579979 RepID=A0A0K0XTL8_9GAMM|nr:hypothetical protein [Wenzhouxiangella marina]AKS41028.1 Lauroyl/myristoyl acyltransferase [Wenzhouxiangella marina]MBB6087906.1 KDO2-lipid IV(A) lauroyltransferase [Wenzhouxiangella marina]